MVWSPRDAHFLFKKGIRGDLLIRGKGGINRPYRIDLSLVFMELRDPEDTNELTGSLQVLVLLLSVVVEWAFYHALSTTLSTYQSSQK